MRFDWRVLESGDPPLALAEAVGGHPLIAQLLARRGLTDVGRARAFLDPQQYTPASPHDLPGMAQAAAILRSAIAGGDRLRIWGDLDADGHTATAVLYEALSALEARVDYCLPSPQEGHGLHVGAVERALGDGIAVLITCDTGIGDLQAVRRGVEGGLRMIITDHHDLPETLPEAHALVDPKMLDANHPLYALSGVGVAYMLAQAMLCDAAQAESLERMLDLVALGLVADVATQVDDVRYLIQRGLAVMRLAQRPGLVALARMAELDLAHAGAEDLAYSLGPRLNAAGRLGDSEMVVRLLVTQDLSEALELAGRVEALSTDRRARIEATLGRAERIIEGDRSLLRPAALILDGEGWDGAVLGVVAAELARRYARPAILIAHREGQPSMGSARSVEGVDVHAAIAAQREHLLREGGHPMAAGFALARQEVEPFVRGLQAWLQAAPVSPPTTPFLEIDAELPWDEISLDLAREVERLAPFGAGNPEPVFSLRGATLERLESLGRDGQRRHKRLHLASAQGERLQVIWFNAEEAPQLGEPIDVALTLRTGYWRGRARLELRLVDWRPAGGQMPRERERVVGGRQLIDLRGEADACAALSGLQAQYGERLSVWAEGLVAPLAGSYTRVDLRDRRALALALATPPPDPETLRTVLAAVKPQRVYLLPSLPQLELTLESVARFVLGMARAALERHGGRPELDRMASRLGLPQAAILLTLEYLQALAKLRVSHDDQGLRVEQPDRATESADSQPSDAQDQDTHAGTLREPLARALAETRAYREAWSVLPPEALLATPDG